jgi:hypothetical protein
MAKKKYLEVSKVQFKQLSQDSNAALSDPKTGVPGYTSEFYARERVVVINSEGKETGRVYFPVPANPGPHRDIVLRLLTPEQIRQLRWCDGSMPDVKFRNKPDIPAPQIIADRKK